MNPRINDYLIGNLYFYPEGYIYCLDKLENVAYDDNRKEELLKLMKMIYAKNNEERLEIAKGSERLKINN